MTTITTQNNELTPKEAFTWLAKIMPGCRNDDLEKIIATDAYSSYRYAFNVLKGRFELGEPIIATDSFYSYLYAREVIQGRFELGEPAIAKGYNESYMYAVNVLKGRFELGEPEIYESGLVNFYKSMFNIK